MSTYKAHIFKQRNVGEREEVKLKMFMPDGTPIDFSGGGGGGGGFQKKEVVFDHSEILQLRATPQEVIAPTETGLDYGMASSVPVLMAAHFSLKVGASYGNFSDDINSLCLCYGADWSEDAAIAMEMAPNFVTGEMEVRAKNMQNFMTSDVDIPIRQSLFQLFYLSAPSYADNGIYLTMMSPGESGPLTGGDPEDQLKITVWYEVIEMV